MNSPVLKWSVYIIVYMVIVMGVVPILVFRPSTMMALLGVALLIGIHVYIGHRIYMHVYAGDNLTMRIRQIDWHWHYLTEEHINMLKAIINKKENRK